MNTLERIDALIENEDTSLITEFDLFPRKNILLALREALVEMESLSEGLMYAEAVASGSLATGIAASRVKLDRTLTSIDKIMETK